MTDFKTLPLIYVKDFQNILLQFNKWLIHVFENDIEKHTNVLLEQTE